VHVLNDQHYRLLLGKTLQQREQQLEQPGAGRFRVAAGRRGAELRQQPGQLGAALPGKQRAFMLSPSRPSSRSCAQRQPAGCGARPDAAIAHRARADSRLKYVSLAARDTSTSRSGTA
jgi:hypothetical protein